MHFDRARLSTHLGIDGRGLSQLDEGLVKLSVQFICAHAQTAMKERLQ
jgi:hypothetical protein